MDTAFVSMYTARSNYSDTATAKYNTSIQQHQHKTSIKPVIFDHFEKSLEDAATATKLWPDVTRNVVNYSAVQLHSSYVANGCVQLSITCSN